MRRSRLAVIVLMVASIAVAAVTRDAAWDMQHRLTAIASPGKAASGATIASMNSFALALLLGGLRGPLVMVLWASSEAQKADRDLEDFDTKIEWIRLLQPEFDTVHIFQIWNKAYNVSAQMISLDNKYTSILEAIDYARDVNRIRPDNINILSSIAQVYSQKLGNSTEQRYYQDRVRAETVPHKPRQKLQWGQQGFRRVEMDILLDENFNVLPALVRANKPRPTDFTAQIMLPSERINDLINAAAKAGVSLDQAALTRNEQAATASVTLPEWEVARIHQLLYEPDVRYLYRDWNTGAELQYLPKYQPYPYGLSPVALGYNYSKRAQVLQSVGHQKPLQLGPSVVDRGAALALKQWAENEWARAQNAELQAYAVKGPIESVDPIVSTSSFGLNRPIVDRAMIPVLLYTYDLSARLCLDATDDLQRHLSDPQYLTYAGSYRLHLDGLAAQFYLLRADHDFIAAATGDPARRDWYIASASTNYQKAMEAYQLIVLTYYVDDSIAQQLYPSGYSKANISKLPAADRETLYAEVEAALANISNQYQDSSDRIEYERYFQRAHARLTALLAPQTRPTTTTR